MLPHEPVRRRLPGGGSEPGRRGTPHRPSEYGRTPVTVTSPGTLLAEFIRVFEAAEVEAMGGGGAGISNIESHHNVGGLPSCVRLTPSPGRRSPAPARIGTSGSSRSSCWGTYAQSVSKGTAAPRVTRWSCGR